MVQGDQSNGANWTNWINWTPDTRGWTPGGPEERCKVEAGRTVRTIRSVRSLRSLRSLRTMCRVLSSEYGVPFQNAAVQDERSPTEKKRVESERFFIGFHKILINRTFERTKVSLLHSILVLLLLHLLAQLLEKRLFIESNTNYFSVDAEANRQHRYPEGILRVQRRYKNYQQTSKQPLTYL